MSLGGLLQAREQTSPTERAEAVLEALKPLVRARYSDASVRLGDLERLVDGVSVVEDLSTWLADLTLDPPASTSDLAGEPHLR